MVWGSHCLKMWSSTQANIALSSAEAELYALTKGAAQGLGMMSLMSDFGVGVSVTIHIDASAAIGIVRRAGLGKLRHLNVRYLRVQDQVKREQLGLEKVAGTDNPADLAMKHFNAELMKKHLERLGVRTGVGRARSAPLLGSLGRRGRRGGVARRSNIFFRFEQVFACSNPTSVARDIVGPSKPQDCSPPDCMYAPGL